MGCGAMHHPNSRIVLCYDCGGDGYKLYDADDFGAQTYRGKCWTCDSKGLLWVRDYKKLQAAPGIRFRCTAGVGEVTLQEWQLNDERIKARQEEIGDAVILAYPNLRKKPHYLD